MLHFVATGEGSTELWMNFSSSDVMMDQSYALKVWIKSTFDISLNDKKQSDNSVTVYTIELNECTVFLWQRSTFAVIKWIRTFFFLKMTQV